MTLPSGAKLGHYEIVCPVGRGGMGEVYRARDARLGRTVAIKILPPELSANATARQRFEREAKLIAKLNHPHICTLLDIGTEGDSLYLVMEYLEGETLKERLARAPMDLALILDTAIGITEALHKAHRQNLIHRDLKPGNVIIAESGAKLLDFGLAKSVLGPPEANAETASQVLDVTQSGNIVGTLSYMSPEQLRNKPLDPRTDLWSLGAILYEMASRRRPFDAPTQSDVISHILLKNPPPISALVPGMPERLSDIVDKTLQKNPDERYQTALDLLNDIKQLKQKLEVQGELERMASGTHASWHAALAAGASGAHTTGAAPLPATPLGWSPASGYGPVALPAPPARRIPRGLIATAICAILLTGAAIGYYLYQNQADSLAVLPFAWVNEPGAPPPTAEREQDRDYLAEGITDSIIASVSQFRNLKVVARTSVVRYKGREVDPARVAKELGVRSILVGRIRQRQDILLISVELMDAAENRQIWGDRFERRIEDLVSLPREVSAEISNNLRARWNRGPVSVRAETTNSEAYQLYLKGRYFWNKRTQADLRRAIDYYRQALSKDPKYASAHMGLAESYVVQAFYDKVSRQEALANARKSAQQALAIDDSLAEAHATLAVVLIESDYDLPGAFRSFQRAIELKPNFATGHQWYAEYLSCDGRHEQAATEIRRALELDPLSVAANSAMAANLLAAHRYDAAIVQAGKAIELDRNIAIGHRILQDAYVMKGKFEQAIGEYQLTQHLGGESSEVAEAAARDLRAAYTKLGATGYWEKRLALALAAKKRGTALPHNAADTTPYRLAVLYARVGQDDAAVRELQTAVEEHDDNVFYLKNDPSFDKLRSDARVQALMHRIGLTS